MKIKEVNAKIEVKLLLLLKIIRNGGKMEEREFKILCIDGGGARGIYPAHILKRIQEDLKIDFLEEFDLIAGTSTGSIIAAGIACELPLETICSMYENMTEKIFKKRFMSGNGIITSKYSNEELKKILEQNFGNKKMGELKIKLLIPSTDLGNGQVYVHKTPYNPEFIRDEIGRASCRERVCQYV